MSSISNKTGWSFKASSYMCLLTSWIWRS